MKRMFLICLSVYCFYGSSQSVEEPERIDILSGDEATEEQKRASIEESIDQRRSILCNSKNAIKSFIVKKNEDINKSFLMNRTVIFCGDYSDSIDQIIKTMVCSGELDMDELIWVTPEIEINVEYITALTENTVCS